jgi:hypothetical protein
MARPPKPNNTKDIQCVNCNNTFTIPNYKHRQFCSVTCSQQYTKSKNKDWLVKRDVTNIDKYGVKSPLQSEQVKDKYKYNLMQKHGVDNPFLVKEYKDKANDTIMERYGYQHANQNKEIASKISHALKGKIRDRKAVIELRWEKIQAYCETENLEPLFDKQYLIDNLIKDIRVKFRCRKCNNITELSIVNGYLPTCNKCSNYKGYSLIEDEITRFIQQHYDGEILLKNRAILSGRREIDIYLPALNLAFEINGIYWHSEIWGKYREYHLSKTEEMISKNIHLVHIFDYEWLYKKDIIQSIILNKLNVIPTKIHARKCNIKLVNSEDKIAFMNDNHIQGNCISSINLGLYYQDNLISMMTFGQNRFKQDGTIELLRFCNKININVVGGASRLFQYYIRNYNPQTIVTFADRRFSLGRLYPILGFEFHSFTKPSYFYWKSMKIYNRMSFQKHMLKDKLDKFDPKLSEYNNMLVNGYNRVWDCGNYKFIWKNKSPNFR